MKKIIYYHFPKNYFWMLLNADGILAICLILYFNPHMAEWWQTKLFIAVFVISTIMWVYKYLLLHKMAVIDEKTIQIDFTNPLKWTDIKCAEERIVDFCGKKKRLIVLIPKDNIYYKYNFLQRHNGVFTPFSIPLYGILSAEDEKDILNILYQKTKLIRL